jgi:hypothetical protein
MTLPHCRGCPDSRLFARRSAATVVHCGKEAFRATPCITSFTETPLGHAVQATWVHNCSLPGRPPLAASRCLSETSTACG